MGFRSREVVLDRNKPLNPASLSPAWPFPSVSGIIGRRQLCRAEPVCVLRERKCVECDDGLLCVCVCGCVGWRAKSALPYQRPEKCGEKKKHNPVSILGWGRGQKMDAFQLPDKRLAPAAAKADAKCRLHRSAALPRRWLLRVRFSTLGRTRDPADVSELCVLRVFFFYCVFCSQWKRTAHYSHTKGLHFQLTSFSFSPYKGSLFSPLQTEIAVEGQVKLCDTNIKKACC